MAKNQSGQHITKDALEHAYSFKKRLGDTVIYYASAYITNGTFASYPGGDAGFIKYLQSHMRPMGNLKVAALNDTANAVAKVHINFEIEKDGTIPDVRLTKDIDHQTDGEMVRIIKLSVWKPAIQNDQPVADGYGMYIWFIKK